MLKNWGVCFSFWIMLFEADYAKNHASIMYQCLPSLPLKRTKVRTSGFNYKTLKCIQNTVWSPKCEFFESPHPPKWILFVSLGFFELLRWPLKLLPIHSLMDHKIVKEAAHEKRYLMAFSIKFEIFRYSCCPGFQKYAIENRFEISWFITELRLFL